MTPLPANIDNFRAATQYLFHHDSTRDMIFVGVVLVSLFALWGLLHVSQWITSAMNQAAQTPHALFLELCRSHRLSRADQKRLVQAAALVVPEDAARLFLHPELLRQAVVAAGNDPEYARLATRIHGSLGKPSAG
jgi:hypothetical protein